jgi:hypothetical protein
VYCHVQFFSIRRWQDTPTGADEAPYRNGRYRRSRKPLIRHVRGPYKTFGALPCTNVLLPRPRPSSAYQPLYQLHLLPPVRLLVHSERLSKSDAFDASILAGPLNQALPSANDFPPWGLQILSTMSGGRGCFNCGGCAWCFRVLVLDPLSYSFEMEADLHYRHHYLPPHIISYISYPSPSSYHHLHLPGDES